MTGQFGQSTVSAGDSYRRFVNDGQGARSPFVKLRHRLVLGDDSFVAATCMSTPTGAVSHAPRTQRRVAALTLAEIAMYFGVSSKTVSRAVNKAGSDIRRATLSLSGPA